jgi:hypothetical protein
MISNDETLAIGLIDGGNVYGDFSFNLARSILELSFTDRKINSIFRVNGSHISVQREKLIHDWINSPWTTDWILLLDSDILITKEHIEKLVSCADKDKFPIVSGLYFILRPGEGSEMRDIPEPCIYTGDYITNNYSTNPIYKFPIDSFIPIDGAGLGITLVHKSVIKKILIDNPKEKLFRDSLDNGNQAIGEDLWFYSLIKNHGFQPYCHTGVNPKHLKIAGVDLQYVINGNFIKLENEI